jgi:hypothetical protein
MVQSAATGGLVFVSVALSAFRHLVENWLDRWIGLEHGRMHGDPEFSVRLPHFVVRGSHRRVLHGFFVRSVQLLPFVRRKTRETVVAMTSPTCAMPLLIFAAGNRTKLRRCR